MSHEQDYIQHYISKIDEWHSFFKVKEPDWLQAINEGGKSTFSEKGFPTLKNEAWKYTSADIFKKDFLVT